MAATYYRVDTGGSQQPQTLALLQQSIMRVCGYGARQSGGGVSDIPSVKAYYGTLPSTKHGIEFTTSVVPTSCNPIQGGNVSWSKGSAGVINEPNDMVCILVDTIKLQY